MTSDDRLSTREVGKIKKLIIEKEKMERRNNIVIKGANLERVDRYKKEENEGWVKEFLKEKLDLQVITL